MNTHHIAMCFFAINLLSVFSIDLPPKDLFSPNLNFELNSEDIVFSCNYEMMLRQRVTTIASSLMPKSVSLLQLKIIGSVLEKEFQHDVIFYVSASRQVQSCH